MADVTRFIMENTFIVYSLLYLNYIVIQKLQVKGLNDLHLEPEGVVCTTKILIIPSFGYPLAIRLWIVLS